jgi:hypothetical protein
MRKKNKNIGIFIIIAFLVGIVIISKISTIRASNSIPSNFYQNLDLNTSYKYNITEYNSTKPLQWLNFNWETKAYTNTSIGGQIIVNFTGFYDKNESDLNNIFDSPMPYMDIKFFENVNDQLILNHTFFNVSNGEADMNLLTGYNKFKSGFLISIDNFDYLSQKAIEQDEGFFEADIEVKEYENKIKFQFVQNSTNPQITTSIYCKGSGILLYTNTSYGNYTLEMSLNNPPEVVNIISSYPILLIGASILFGSIMISHKIRKKN